MERHEKAAESLMGLLPLMHEKFLNPMERIATDRMSKLQFFALMMLFRKGPQTMTELSSAMQISKQQMTPLVDRLLELEVVRRLADEQDRRIVRIDITEAGRELMSEMKRQNLKALAKKLSVLPECDLIELDTMMLRVRELLEKADTIVGEKEMQKGCCR